jgi:hypothetical protein
MDDSLRRALAARVGDILPGPTPLVRCRTCRRLGVRVLLKRET